MCIEPCSCAGGVELALPHLIPQLKFDSRPGETPAFALPPRPQRHQRSRRTGWLVQEQGRYDRFTG